MIKRCRSTREPGWLALREALWPHGSREAHLSEMAQWCSDPGRFAAFVAYSGAAVGFAEVAIRSDYVNGAETSPVGFLEGIYVAPAWRRKGIARELLEASEQWVIDAGCTELASDAALDNVLSHAMHAALGFQETERVVFFRKKIGS